MMHHKRKRPRGLDAGVWVFQLIAYFFAAAFFSFSLAITASATLFGQLA